MNKSTGWHDDKNNSRWQDVRFRLSGLWVSSVNESEAEDGAKRAEGSGEWKSEKVPRPTFRPIPLRLIAKPNAKLQGFKLEDFRLC